MNYNIIKHPKKIKRLLLPCYGRSNFHVLGIESSCDDTGASVVNDSGKVLGESHCSQSVIHVEAGGILPHVASALHKNNLKHVVNSAMLQSKLKFENLDVIAVTVKPGLILSLTEGVNYAKNLCTLYNKPLIPIHHMEAHALTVRIIDEVKFPFLVFLLSGGHCILALANSVRKFYKLGDSNDNSPGQVFDKIARRAKLINLNELKGLVGGAAIEKAAKTGNPTAIPFSQTTLKSQKNCNFSFSGYITSAYNYIQSQEINLNLSPDAVIPDINDFCASFQWSLTTHLCQRLEMAIKYVEERKLLNEDEKRLVVSGGVASNSLIKNALKFVCNHYNYKIFIPPPRLCTDNGVMIAWNGVELLKENFKMIYPHELQSIEPQANPFGEDISDDVANVMKNFTFSKSSKVKLQKFIENAPNSNL
ncbi:conserved hypothetical protein [Pediculus humanus corporis]|uniref:N(6)-L-threonylcarbamoyladenine synthase n=1 Tax=Pediculus humanus subsp. corporis TaxID=121224 RepID=E0VDW1_PEDHC|nr:uncharacterized protein Phum_PHUM125780 [Pediculus humanus corporis]EEB11567.1 conserved hypothetical protein [Pediculus humanus corporis]